MSTNISRNELKKFIIQNYGMKVSEDQAKKAKIDRDDFKEADVDENQKLDIEEIFEDKDLYAQFATICEQEKEKKQSVKDKEKEKQEQTQVKDKKEAGV